MVEAVVLVGGRAPLGRRGAQARQELIEGAPVQVNLGIRATGAQVGQDRLACRRVEPVATGGLRHRLQPLIGQEGGDLARGQPGERAQQCRVEAAEDGPDLVQRRHGEYPGMVVPGRPDG